MEDNQQPTVDKEAILKEAYSGKAYSCPPDKEIRAAMDTYSNELRKENDELRSALQELVGLKQLKDSQGKTEDYLIRQPSAWERAMKIINQKQTS